MKKVASLEILNNFQASSIKDLEQQLIDILLTNRGLVAKKERDIFLHPDLSFVTAKTVGINNQQLKKAVERIQEAKEKKEQAVVYGDYDVDGITGTAILWETLSDYGLRIMPYIPSRVEEGYGLSIKGIQHILADFPETKVIITVDNGIVANEAVDFARKNGIDVIITDHHVANDTLPKAYAIVHTTKLCGAGVGWILSKEFNHATKDHLELVALATIADMVPLTFANRIVLTEGLVMLRTTKRPGIVALCEEAKIDQKKIGVYEIGHILAPRLNAMGRISSAMDSLRLLCTKDRLRAKVLAEKHGLTNKSRQELTISLSEMAIQKTVQSKDNILLVAHETFDEGVIGLVAGRLVEKYYRPSIVIARKEEVSKASARSVAGFNIIEFIRSGSHLLINAGGHPMAAGFTIATNKIKEFEEFVKENAEKFDTTLLAKKIKIDCPLPLQYVSQKLFDALQILQPFGIGNPEPLFVSQAIILSVKQIGKEKQHLSFVFQPVITTPHHSDSFVGHSERSEEYILRPAQDDKKNGSPISGTKINAIAFGIGERYQEFLAGQKVDIVYTISENEWNNTKTLQLKLRDIQPTR